jgi:hypothetical protein
VTVQIHCKASIKRRATETASASTSNTALQTTPINQQSRRARSLTEGVRDSTRPQGSGTSRATVPWGEVGGHYQGPFADLQGRKTASNILDLTDEEKASKHNFDKKSFQHVLRRERTAEKGVTRASFRDKMAAAADRSELPEQFEIVYIATYDLKVSNKEELTKCLCRVKTAMEIGNRQRHLFVIGDQQY